MSALLCQCPAAGAAGCRRARRARSGSITRASAYGSDPYGVPSDAAAGNGGGLARWLQSPWDVLAFGPRATAGVLLHGQQLCAACLLFCKCLPVL
jgi:hypothetical protein